MTGEPNLSASVITPAAIPITSDADFYAIPLPDGNIVYHYGSLNPPLPADTDMQLSRHIGAYSIDGTNVPCHWWNAVWVMRKGPLVIKRSPAELIASHRMFPMGQIDPKVIFTQTYPRAPFTGSMQTSNVTLYMPTTGERPDIGWVTDNISLFVMGGDPSPMLDWAQVAASVPVHFRDQATGRPVNLLIYPAANAYDLPGYQGRPWLCKGPKSPQFPGRDPDNYSHFGGGWDAQQAHFPELCGVAQMATGDLALLLSLQYHANFMVLTNAEISAIQSKAIFSGELRGRAWAFIKLFMAHVATKDAEAAGLQTGDGTPFLPSGYFKTLLDQALTYYTPQMGLPLNQATNLAMAAERYSPWMQDYLCCAQAYGILTDHADWAETYLFNLGNVIKRTNGKSGWPVAYPTPYRINATVDGAVGAPIITYAQAFDEQVTDPETAISQAEHDALMADQYNGGKATLSQDRGYLMVTRAALAMAVYLDNIGKCAVRARWPDLDTCYANVHRMVVANGDVNPRDSILTTTMEITMASTKLTVGETKHSTLTITPISADETGLTYTAAPDGLVTLAPDATGVNVTGVAAGIAIITASLNGLTATAEADVSLPLALSLALSWDS